MRRGIRCRLSILVTLTMLMAVGVGAEDAKETAAKNAEVDDGVDVYFRASNLCPPINQTPLSTTT